MTLVYIGCGTDFDLLSKLPQIKEFVYIDSQPKSAYGYIEFDTGYFHRKNYMKNFSENIDKSFIKINVVPSYPDVYLNFSTNQTLYHYYSMPFPWTSRIFRYNITKDDINKLTNLLGNTSHLVIKGYSPSTKIFKYFNNNQITLITDKNTYYPSNINKLDDEDVNKITSDLLLNTNNIQNRIKEILYFNNKTFLNTYKTYNEFIIDSKTINNTLE
jgi:hypothetical protein